MSDAELLIQEIKTLPPGRVAEVLDFVEFIRQKETRNAESAARGGSDSWFEKGEECPICARHRDPVTGELRFNAETIAAFEEGDAMLRGEIPAKWHKSLEDLDKILGL
jgi:hypothetical protein